MQDKPTKVLADGAEPCLIRLVHFSLLQDVERLKLNNLVSLNYATQTMDSNPIRTAINVCSQLIKRKVSYFVPSFLRLFWFLFSTH